MANIEERAKRVLTEVGHHWREDFEPTTPEIMVAFAESTIEPYCKALAELVEAGTLVIKQWHHFEAHDDGDKGYKELGDKLESSLAAAKKLLEADNETVR